MSSETMPNESQMMNKLNATLPKLMTAVELEELPSMMDGNDYRYELIRGELKILSLNEPVHGIITARITMLVGQYKKSFDLGLFCVATGFIVERDPDTVLGADVAFISHNRLAAIENFDNFIPFAPDLAIEVLNSTDAVEAIHEKVALYFAAGSKALWIFYPKRRTVAVYASPTDVRILTEADTLDGGDVLPGFQLSLAKLYAVIKR